MFDGTCLHCGEPTPEKGPTGPRPSYCSRTCRNSASYAKRRDAINAAKREASTARLAAIVKTCPRCGESFTPERTVSQRFCSKACSDHFAKVNNQRKCSADGCPEPHRARGLCSSHYNATFDADRSRRSHPETRRRNLRIKTQRRRALMSHPDAERIDRDVVGERDQWKCGICLKRVDNSIPWPKPLSPSLDHIVPLSQGGEHTYANSRISHLSCNMQRSNQGGGEQLFLIG